jgi:hypothetical protein
MSMHIIGPTLACCFTGGLKTGTAALLVGFESKQQLAQPNTAASSVLQLLAALLMVESFCTAPEQCALPTHSTASALLLSA